MLSITCIPKEDGALNCEGLWKLIRNQYPQVACEYEGGNEKITFFPKSMEETRFINTTATNNDFWVSK